MNDLIENNQNIETKIFTIRGLQVMIDRDLAELYQVETKYLNRAVNRNLKRFPQKFRFQLTKDEYENLRFQIGTLSLDNNKSAGEWGKHSKYLPYVFTEQGVSMLSAVLKSDVAIDIVDNYVDDSVLTLFSKNQDIDVTIYTNTISKQLRQDVEKYNAQYRAINIKNFKDSHDRFLIIDETQIYHIGASLKDLGKKWFAFSKMDMQNINILEKLQKEKQK